MGPVVQVSVAQLARPHNGSSRVRTVGHGVVMIDHPNAVAPEFNEGDITAEGRITGVGNVVEVVHLRHVVAA